MSFCSKKLIIVLLLHMASIETMSSNNRMILRSESPKNVQVKRSYANLLNSLTKLNQERVTALKKLYVLNSITYGKDSLRSNIENELDDYDEMQGRLIRALKHILDNLEQTPKATLNENDIHQILQNNDHIFGNPIEEQEKDEINNRRERIKVKNALRNEDSDNDSSNENSNDKSDSKDDSKSSSLEKQNEDAINEVQSNGTQGRSYYYYQYGCGRGRVRCIRACKEAYRYACDYYYCRSSLRSELRSACKSECRSWFY